mgnify:FL=1
MSKNKILAVSFLSLACVFFFGYYAYAEIRTSFTFFRSSDWIAILYFVLDAVMYLILLVANIRNDDFAYTGIALFVSMETFSYLQKLFYGQMSFVNVLYSGSPLLIILGTFYILFLAAEAGVGIALYVLVVRYQRGFPYFKPIRILGILFACSIALASLSYFGLFLGSGIDAGAIFSLLATPMAEVFASVGIVFTLERLRRI